MALGTVSENTQGLKYCMHAKKSVTILSFLYAYQLHCRWVIKHKKSLEVGNGFFMTGFKIDLTERVFSHYNETVQNKLLESLTPID